MPSLKNAAIPVVLCLLAAMGAVGMSHVSRSSSHVTSMFPTPGSENVPGVRIHIAFDGPVDAARLMLEVWAQKPEGPQVQITGAVEVNEQRTAALFRSYRPLPAGEIRVRSSINGHTPHEWAFVVSDKVPLHLGRGGPILLALGKGAPFGKYITEILRTEGFTNFRTIGAEDIQPSVISEYRLIITAGSISGQTTAMLREWTVSGGHLIAVRPSDELAELAGIRNHGDALPESELTIDTTQPPGKGLVSEKIRLHGSVGMYVADAGTRTLATLSGGGEGAAPALTIRTVGDRGGEVAAFAFDLAQSVVLTRQGNPQWAGQDRDGLAPIRPNDLFFGMAANDPRPDFLDLSRVWIPQADEQMRLLTNLIQHLQRDGGPVPKFWYFPGRKKAVLVMAADDHGTRNGTRDSFNRMLALDKDGCSVSRWECARATSWLYSTSGLSAGAARDFSAAGFDVGSHISTYCKNWSMASLDLAFATDIRQFRSAYPGLPAQRGSRLHCIVWSDFIAQAEISRNWGIRFDMNYYYWPAAWINGRAGFMTGSGLPMRFSSADGDLINVYQQETHLVDEVFNDDRDAVERLVQRALGPEQFFGAFGTHYDFHNSFDIFLMDLAQKYDIPMVSARQMMDWLDGRSQTDVLDQRWDGERLDFTIAADERTSDMLTAMLPSSLDKGHLVAITRNEIPVAFDTEVIKGVSYALFPGMDGDYRATYGNEISILTGPAPVTPGDQLQPVRAAPAQSDGCIPACAADDLSLTGAANPS
jgi:hypothetical protein